MLCCHTSCEHNTRLMSPPLHAIPSWLPLHRYSSPRIGFFAWVISSSVESSVRVTCVTSFVRMQAETGETYLVITEDVSREIVVRVIHPRTRPTFVLERGLVLVVHVTVTDVRIPSSSRKELPYAFGDDSVPTRV